MTRNARATRVVAGVAFAIGLFLLPFLVSSYKVSQLNQYLILVIAILGLNVLSGFSGQISLGHGAFLAIGAYTSAILIQRFGVHYAATIPAAAIVCFGAGLLIGFPALRLAGHYLALATFGLSLAMPQMLKYKKIETWTGGVQGILFNRPDPPFTLTLLGQAIDADRWLYFLTLGIAVAVFVLTWNLLRGRIGRALVALRDHPIAASTMGVNLAAYKSITFGISASITGIAGSLIAISTAFVAPDSFTVLVSISLLVGSVIGGITSIAGPLFGAMFIHVMPDVAQQIFDSAPAIIYGAVLLFAVYVMPNGVSGLGKAMFKGRARAKLQREKPDSRRTDVQPGEG